MASCRVRCAPGAGSRCAMRSRRCAPRAPCASAPSPRDAAPTPAVFAELEVLPRRALLAGSAGAALLAALPMPPSALAEATPPVLDGVGRTVILTGCNTGIGYDAAGKLAARGFTVVMACRTANKAQAAAASLLTAGAPVAGTLEPAECDLASLASVRSFAAGFVASGRPLHLLCLNAGLQYSGDNTVRRTADGFEVTVGTNHLGHFLLANLLLPSLEKAGKGARVVVTASEVHDPASPGGAVGPGATLGDLRGLASQGAAFEMIDGGAYDADKAYKDSKLCNILFTRELARRLAAAGSPVEAVAFGPGLITRTGFFRNQNPVFTALFDFATNEVFHVAESVSGGGDCLVTMATRADLPSGVYYNNDLDGKGGHRFEAQPPSKEAQSDDEAARLWALSAQLVGLPA